MGRISSYGKRSYSTDDDLIIRARGSVQTGRRAVVWCHEHGAAAHYVGLYPQFGLDLIALAGSPTISGDLSGATHWGNDASQDAVQGCWDALLADNPGLATDKVILMCYSMGHLAGFNWALRPCKMAKVAAIASFLPAVNLFDLHSNDRGGFATEIETAYGGLAAYNAAQTSHNPAASASSFAGVPIKMWYSTDDTLVVPAVPIAFAAASGATLRSLGAVGHTSASVDPDEVFDFVRHYIVA